MLGCFCRYMFTNTTRTRVAHEHLYQWNFVVYFPTDQLIIVNNILSKIFS